MALLALGMTLVIATRGIDLSVGAVIGDLRARSRRASPDSVIRLPMAVAALRSASALLCGLWNGLLVAVLGIQPIVATLILMVAGRGIAQLITEGRIVTFYLARSGLARQRLRARRAVAGRHRARAC